MIFWAIYSIFFYFDVRWQNTFLCFKTTELSHLCGKIFKRRGLMVVSLKKLNALYFIFHNIWGNWFSILGKILTVVYVNTIDKYAYTVQHKTNKSKQPAWLSALLNCTGSIIHPVEIVRLVHSRTRLNTRTVLVRLIYCNKIYTRFYTVLSLYSYTIWRIEKYWFVTDFFADWFENRFFCLSTNAIHKKLLSFLDFFQKIDSFWKRLILLKRPIEPSLFRYSQYLLWVVLIVFLVVTCFL